ncbi:MAG: hypothetical protein CMM56_03640 [Rhodospirillaceae bacterium]|nr:hypothetical protein [Rhodospirillaceae bacterium]|tara:strand:- start:119 stop:481 length:363 start_codon:yes stop_codon:yes gene_type:complete
MLNFYSVLSRFLITYRLVIWIVAVSAACFLIGFIVLGEPAGDPTYTLASIVILLWALCLVIVGQIFSVPLKKSGLNSTIIQRIKHKLSKSIRWLMALITTALFFFVIWLSLKTLSLFFYG